MSKCDCIAIRLTHNNNICRVEVLPTLLKHEARDSYISTERPPFEVKLKILKEFKKFCPKCGAKIDYEIVKEKLKGEK